MNEILEAEQKQTIDTEVYPALEKAKALIVRNPEERSLAAVFIDGLKEMKERIEIRFHPTSNKKKAYEVYEDLLETEKAFYVPIDLAIELSRKIIRKFDTDETIRIQREQREAQEKKDQQEREEKAKREAEAKAEQEAEERRQLEEFERLEKEKKDKLALQQAATEAGNSKVAGIAAKEIAKIDNQIQTVVEEGEKKIEAIQRKAEESPAPKMVFAPPPMPTKRLVTKAEVVNMQKLCKLIADGIIPFNVVWVNQSELNKWAKDMDHTRHFEGLRLFPESVGRI